MWKRWLSLFCYLVAQSLLSLALLCIMLSVKGLELQALLYFWTYWIGTFAVQLLEFWIIAQIASELGGISKDVKRYIYFGVAFTALLSLGISTILTLQTPMPLYGCITHIVLGISKTVSLAWLATFLGIALGSEVLGLGWPRGARVISTGYAISAIGTATVHWLLMLYHNTTLLSDASDTIYLLALIIWAWSVRKTIPPYDLGKAEKTLRIYVNAIQKARENTPLKCTSHI